MCIKRSFAEETADGYKIFCDITHMGNDKTLCVWGGDAPHIGSVVMSVARESLTGEGISATSSVINAVGHKDEYIARMFAEAVAVRYNCTAVCACGIHIDMITSEQLDQVKNACRRLLEKIK